MTNKDILDLFFLRVYERQLNENILNDRDYIVPLDGILNYVCEILSVPYGEYLQYIKKHQPASNITSKNITQSSTFESCERNMVKALMEEYDKGLTFIEIGKHFPEYIRKHNDIAYRKYGENQVKTAEQLGLTYEYFNHWYLNCVGYIYNELPEEDKFAYLARAILRDPLYHRIMADLLERDIDILDYMYCIESAETKARRYDSVMRLVKICINECCKSNIPLHVVIDSKNALSDKKKEEKALKSKTNNRNTLYRNQYDDINVGLFAYAAERPEIYKGISFYKFLFADLRCYIRQGKRAPYKALLIMAVANLIQRNIIASVEIYPTEELKCEFNELALTMDYDRQLFRPSFDNPFVHLAGDDFWELVPKSNIPNDKKISQLRQIEYARINEELFELFKKADTKDKLMQVLFDNYFEK